jgi:hypothetical protein
MVKDEDKDELSLGNNNDATTPTTTRRLLLWILREKQSHNGREGGSTIYGSTLAPNLSPGSL